MVTFSENLMLAVVRDAWRTGQSAFFRRLTACPDGKHDKSLALPRYSHADMSACIQLHCPVCMCHSTCTGRHECTHRIYITTAYTAVHAERISARSRLLITVYFYHVQGGDLDGTCNAVPRRIVTECFTLTICAQMFIL